MKTLLITAAFCLLVLLQYSTFPGFPLRPEAPAPRRLGSGTGLLHDSFLLTSQVLCEGGWVIAIATVRVWGVSRWRALHAWGGVGHLRGLCLLEPSCARWWGRGLGEMPPGRLRCIRRAWKGPIAKTFNALTDSGVGVQPMKSHQDPKRRPREAVAALVRTIFAQPANCPEPSRISAKSSRC